MKKYILITFIVLLQACGGEDEPNSSQTVVKAKVDVTDLPDTFVYDLDATQNGAAEYQWDVAFDINNDSIIGVGDIGFRIWLGAFDATPQQVISRGNLTALLIEYGDCTTFCSRSIGMIDLVSTNTSFTYIANINLDPRLNNVSNGTQINVKTIYRDQITGTYYYDYYPANNLYTSGLDTSMLIDGTLDFETNTGPVNGANYPLIDIEAISIIIEQI